MIYISSYVDIKQRGTVQLVAAKGTSPEGHSAATSSRRVFDQRKNQSQGFTMQQKWIKTNQS